MSTMIMGQERPWESCVGKGHVLPGLDIWGCMNLDEAVGINQEEGSAGRPERMGRGSACGGDVAGDYSYESGIRMAEELLDQGPLDAMICATDRLAFGAYRVLGERGLKDSGGCIRGGLWRL